MREGLVERMAVLMTMIILTAFFPVIAGASDDNQAQAKPRIAIATDNSAPPPVCHVEVGNEGQSPAPAKLWDCFVFYQPDENDYGCEGGELCFEKLCRFTGMEMDGCRPYHPSECNGCASDEDCPPDDGGGPW